MKKLVLALFLGLAMAATAAQADVTLKLNYINTNDCLRAQKEIMLLNSKRVIVNAFCSEYKYQGYPANNGRSYNYRLYTHVTILGQVQIGEQIPLNPINTNNPAYAVSEVNLLNTRRITVRAVASDYLEQGYPSDDGRLFNYRVYSTLTINSF